MGAHGYRRGWKGWLTVAAVTILIVAEILIGLILLAVLIDIIRTM
jgi:hypothetical protein